MEQKNIQVEVQGKNVLPTPIKNLRELTAEVTQTGADATEAKALAEVNTEIVADKDYDTAKFSGMGRVNLQKNIVDGHNYLTQEMISKANTIYKIQYDYEIAPVTTGYIAELNQGVIEVEGHNFNYKVIDVNAGDIITKESGMGNTTAILYQTADNVWHNPHTPTLTVEDGWTIAIADVVGGSTAVNYNVTTRSITIPENCVLEFEGGSISGGTLVGNGTGIEASVVKIFSIDIILSSTWNVVEAYPEWFGAKGDFANDDVQYIQKCLDAFKTCYLTGIYLITDTVILSTGYELIGKNNNVFLISRENIHIVKVASGTRYVKIKNVIIRHDGNNNNDNIIGIRTLDNVSNSIFENIKIINCYYGLYLNTAFWQNSVSNIRIDKCVYGIFSGISSASICCIFNNIYIGESENKAIRLEGVKGFSFYNLNIDASGISNAIYLAKCDVYINRFNIESFRGDFAIYCYSNSNLYLENGGFTDIVVSGNTRCLILCETNSTLKLNNVHYTKVETDNLNYGVINMSSVTYSNNSNLTIRGEARDAIYTQQGTFENKPSLSADTDKIGTPYFVNSFNKSIFWNGSYWADSNGYSAALNRGATSDRPTGVVAGGQLRTNDKGFCYFDTDLNKPIYVKSILGNGVVNWVDATGITAGVQRAGLINKRPALTDIYAGFMYLVTQPWEDATLGTDGPAGPYYFDGSANWILADGTSIQDSQMPARS